MKIKRTGQVAVPIQRDPDGKHKGSASSSSSFPFVSGVPCLCAKPDNSSRGVLNADAAKWGPISSFRERSHQTCCSLGHIRASFPGPLIVFSLTLPTATLTNILVFITDVAALDCGGVVEIRA